MSLLSCSGLHQATMLLHADVAVRIEYQDPVDPTKSGQEGKTVVVLAALKGGVLE
jgi:hypothetical protein